MPITKEERRIAFPVAVRMAGYGSVERWAEAHDVVSSYVYQVLRGLESERIGTMLDKEIEIWLGGSAMQRLRARLAREAKHRSTTELESVR